MRGYAILIALATIITRFLAAQVLIDNESKHNGTLYEDYDILPPKTIKARLL